MRYLKHLCGDTYLATEYIGLMFGEGKELETLIAIWCLWICESPRRGWIVRGEKSICADSRGTLAFMRWGEQQYHTNTFEGKPIGNRGKYPTVMSVSIKQMEERISGGGLTMPEKWIFFIKGVSFNVISLICITTAFFNTGILPYFSF